MIVSAESVADLLCMTQGGVRKPNGNGGFVVRCPAHDDHNPSLSVSNATDGKLLVHCFAGCPQDEVIRVLSDLGALPELERTDKPATSGLPKGIHFNYKGSVFTALWPYVSAAGEVLGYVCRYDNAVNKHKEVIPYFTREGDSWKAGAPDAPRPLYGVETLGAPGTVYIVEGEKCAASLHKARVAAVTSLGGSSAARHADWSPVYGRSVILWPDFDKPGIKYISDILSILREHCDAIMVVDVAALHPPFDGWDADDYRITQKPWNASVVAALPLLSASEWLAAKTSGSSKTPPPAKPVLATTNGVAVTPKIHLTDYGNCQRFIKRFGARLRYVPAWDKWLIWDKRRWRPDEDGWIMRLAKDTALSISAEADALLEKSAKAKNKQDFDALTAAAEATRKWARQSESEGRLKAMISLARSEPDVPVDSALLDCQPWYLNCLNGVVDLSTGVLMEHDPSYLITKMIHVDYIVDAEAPVWERYLRDVQPDREIVDFLCRAAGYSACGTAREQVVFIHHGHGQNGKSTFMKAMAAILGSGYCQKGNMSLFAEQSTDRVRNDVACLTGARMLSLSETSDRMVMDEALIKAVSGGDIIKARFLNKEFFEFVPVFTVHIDTNHKPRIRGTENGIWRRLLLIPWNTKIAENKKDLSLEQKLLVEKEGILNWIVRGAKDYLASGLRIPEFVRTASDEYRRDEDILGDWVEQCTVEMAGIKETSDELFKSYERWCSERGIRAIANNTWVSRMQDRGVEKRRVSGAVFWYGIGLKGASYVANKITNNRSFSEVGRDDPEAMI